MPSSMTRRAAMMRAIALTTVIGTGLSRANEPESLDPQDPIAKAFDFVTDASRVDASAHPTFQPGQRCAGCAQYLGKPEDARAPCDIFGGLAVPAGGWCKVWARR